MATEYHVPVLADEVMDLLDPQPGQTVVDATLGGGGHAALLASRLGPRGLLIGIDQDADAIAAGAAALGDGREGGPQVRIAQSRFDSLEETLAGLGVSAMDGILFDLGASSHQLDEPIRGFSFKDPAMPLDMRMNPQGGGATAADLLNSLSEEGMARIFRDYADERWAARIAKFVVERRSARPYAVSGDLVDTVRAAVPAAARSKEIHPATRVYQALRIAVNDEFEVLESGLEQAIRLLRSGVRARIAVISYHSGEDRVVKRAFATHSGHCVCPPSLPMCVCGASDPALELLTKKPVVAGPDEVRRNPRSRSAKLRVAQKL